jgi:hypothetical protein
LGLATTIAKINPQIMQISQIQNKLAGASDPSISSAQSAQSADRFAFEPGKEPIMILESQ